ncbi:uncharacterized protein METZ01_LOCUS40672 [marine metagenome]|uniref:Uncharacterized protein n=1 Tax=marine metagenome TaxID=408172 RepID=A0A381RA53_9ZZZZ
MDSTCILINSCSFNDTGLNFILSPGLIKQGEVLLILNKLIGEFPIIYHPPGLLFGYIPVCDPPIPTAPLGTFKTGFSLRG